MEFFQDFILSRLLIAGGLFIALGALIYWAIYKARQFKGVGLGLALGLFFIIVRLSIGEMVITPDAGVEEYLNGFQVFVATIFGAGIGMVILLALYFGMHNRRAIGIQIALYIAVIMILIFLTLASNPDIQKMIGIFALAVGMTTLFALVLIPDEDNLNIAQGGGTGNSQPVQVPNDAGSGGAMLPPTPPPPPPAKSILEKIREKNQDRYNFKK